MSATMQVQDKAAHSLLVIGGLNWGLIGAFNFSLVNEIFGNGFLSDLIYVVVGVAAVYEAYKIVVMIQSQKKGQKRRLSL